MTNKQRTGKPSKNHFASYSQTLKCVWEETIWPTDGGHIDMTIICHIWHVHQQTKPWKMIIVDLNQHLWQHLNNIKSFAKGSNILENVMTLTRRTWRPALCGGSAPSCDPSYQDLTSIDPLPPLLCTGRLQPGSPGPRADPRGGPRRLGPCAADPGSVRWPGGRWGPEGAGGWGAVGGSAAGPRAEGAPQPRTGCAPGWRQTRGRRPRNWADT